MLLYNVLTPGKGRKRSIKTRNTVGAAERRGPSTTRPKVMRRRSKASERPLKVNQTARVEINRLGNSLIRNSQIRINQKRRSINFSVVLFLLFNKVFIYKKIKNYLFLFVIK